MAIGAFDYFSVCFHYEYLEDWQFKAIVHYLSLGDSGVEVLFSP